jgi:hypothetical protein
VEGLPVVVADVFSGRRTTAVAVVDVDVEAVVPFMMKIVRDVIIGVVATESTCPTTTLSNTPMTSKLVPLMTVTETGLVASTSPATITDPNP